MAVVFLIAAGSIGEGVAERMDAKRFPPPGKMVDVGGYRLHLNCIGAGSPTVVLENGSAAPSVSWALVQPAIAQFTRVCAYDRAGYAWSDPATTPRTGDQIVKDLHTLLERGGEQGPYVLVAHSLGGLYARLYAARYPEQVVGMVLVDARHEDFTAVQKTGGFSGVTGTAFLPVAVVAARIGLLRAIVSIVGIDALAGNIPVELRPLAKATALTPKMMRAVAAEGRQLSGLETAVRAGGSLGAMPLVVLTHGKDMFSASAENGWRQLGAKLAALSTAGRLETAADSGHFIMLDQPDLVTDAVREVTAAVRGE